VPCHEADQLGTIGAGQSRSFQIKGSIDPALGGATSMTNTATVSSAANESDPADNVATLTHLVNELADVRVSKVCKPDTEPAPPASSPTEMADSDFSALTAAIDAESFSQTRLGVLETTLPDTWFTVAQVGALVDLFSFSADKVKVVELTRGNMVDPRNGFKLLSHFTFSADKEAVKKLLK